MNIFKKLKRWVVVKTIEYAENRYSIFVWMRQVNDRLIRLEEKESEQVIQQRAEMEMVLDSKLQKIVAGVGLLQVKVEEQKLDLDRAIFELDNKGRVGREGE